MGLGLIGFIGFKVGFKELQGFGLRLYRGLGFRTYSICKV